MLCLIGGRDRTGFGARAVSDKRRAGLQLQVIWLAVYGIVAGMIIAGTYDAAPGVLVISVFALIIVVTYLRFPSPLTRTVVVADT